MDDKVDDCKGVREVRSKIFSDTFFCLAELGRQLLDLNAKLDFNLIILKELSAGQHTVCSVWAHPSRGLTACQ